MYANMKKTGEAQVGDTLHQTDKPVEPLPGFKPPKPMVKLNYWIIKYELIL